MGMFKGFAVVFLVLLAYGCAGQIDENSAGGSSKPGTQADVKDGGASALEFSASQLEVMLSNADVLRQGDLIEEMTTGVINTLDDAGLLGRVQSNDMRVVIDLYHVEHERLRRYVERPGSNSRCDYRTRIEGLAEITDWQRGQQYRQILVGSSRANAQSCYTEVQDSLEDRLLKKATEDLQESLAVFIRGSGIR